MAEARLTPIEPGSPVYRTPTARQDDTSVIEATPDWLTELEADSSLFEPSRLRQRLDALDRLEDQLAWTAPQHRNDWIAALCARLEATNERLYRSIRHDIQRGVGAETLLEWARAVGLRDDVGRQDDGERYDHVDTLLSGVLQLQEPASGIAELAAEMVFYQPTPARHIFELIRRTALSGEDVLIDLGSGLGHVPLLVAICTRARCIGIEWEAAYVECARRCAAALDLNQATFIRQDARDADLSTGTVFYLYTPFRGAMLGEVLAKLRQVAATREIRIGTLGPCTAIFAREPWLEIDCTTEPDKPALFRSIRM